MVSLKKLIDDFRKDCSIIREDCNAHFVCTENDTLSRVNSISEKVSNKADATIKDYGCWDLGKQWFARKLDNQILNDYREELEPVLLDNHEQIEDGFNIFTERVHRIVDQFAYLNSEMLRSVRISESVESIKKNHIEDCKTDWKKLLEPSDYINVGFKTGVCTGLGFAVGKEFGKSAATTAGQIVANTATTGQTVANTAIVAGTSAVGGTGGGIVASGTAVTAVAEPALIAFGVGAADGAAKGSIGGPVGIAVGAGVGFVVSGVMLYYNLKKRRQNVLQSEVNRVLKGYDEDAKNTIKCGYTTSISHFTSFSRQLEDYYIEEVIVPYWEHHQTGSQ